MMKALFVCLEGYPNGGACSILLHKLFTQKALQELGEIHIMVVKNDGGESDVEQYGNVIVHRFDSLSFLTAKQALTQLKRAPLHVMSTLLERVWRRWTTMLRCSHSFLRRSLVREVSTALDGLHEEDFDVVIPVSGYYEAAFASMRYAKKKKISMMLYQLDPCTTNQVYSAKSYRRRLNFERRLYGYCERIITTPIIAKEMTGLLKEADVAKMMPIMFPNVAPVHMIGCSRSSVEKPFQCAFVGRIYRGARDPRFTMRVFSNLNEDDVKLRMIGVDVAELSNYIEPSAWPKSVECCGSLPYEEVQAIIEDADVLVNIGNIVINQLPSKLFEYISSGKPIVNICTSHECPSIPYMKRYGLALNLFACDENIDEQVQALKVFLHENSGKRLSPETIIREFPECTAKHCAEVIAQVVSTISKH